MSGLLSRRKGKVFERQVADIYRARWPTATVRRAQQGEGAREPDVVIEGDAPPAVRRLWNECQHAKEPAPLLKLAQAERDCAVFTGIPWLPIVVWHKTGSRSTQVTLRLATLAELGLVRPGGDHGSVIVTLDIVDFLAALP